MAIIKSSLSSIKLADLKDNNFIDNKGKFNKSKYKKIRRKIKRQIAKAGSKLGIEMYKNKGNKLKQAKILGGELLHIGTLIKSKRINNKLRKMDIKYGVR